MINGTVICFPIVGYNTIRQRSQQMMSILGKYGITVYHVNPHLTKQVLIAVSTTDTNVLEVFLPVSPYPTRGMNPINAASVAEMLCKYIHGYPVVLWVNAPYWYDLVLHIVTYLGSAGKEYKLVYDVMDAFQHFDDLKQYHDILIKNHNNLLSIADLCIYTANQLKDVLPNINKHRQLLHIPNGVNIEEWNVR